MIDLVDLVTDIVDCEHKTAPQSADGYPLIRTPNIGRGRFELSKVQRINAETYALWTRRTRPRGGDLILAREAPVGGVALVHDGLNPALGQRTVLIRPNHSVVSAHFLNYHLNGPEVQNIFRAQSGGATVPHLNLSDIRGLRIKQLPSVPVQRKIAAILSAYDDLIENSRRRIEILEETARAIYREWFEGFRFPGRKPQSEGKSIPSGWSITPVGKHFSSQYGFTASSKTAQVGPRYLRVMDINKSSFITWVEVPYCLIPDSRREKYRLSRGDIVIARMADPGKVGIIEDDVDAIFASYLVRLKPLSGASNSHYWYYALRSDRYQDFISGASTGATRKSISAEVMKEGPILVPDVQLRERFDATVGPIRSQISSLVSVNTNLAAQRDLLLPKLISGELDVSEFDIDTSRIEEQEILWRESISV